NAESLADDAVASQFLASLMTKGTKKHTRQQLKDELDRLHAKIAGAASPGGLGFTIVCERSTLPRVVELLTEILREPTSPADDFDVMKRQTRDQLEQGLTDPGTLASRRLMKTLSPYSKDDVRYVPSIGESIERLEKVTLKQVRELYEKQLGGQH